MYPFLYRGEIRVTIVVANERAISRYQIISYQRSDVNVIIPFPRQTIKHLFGRLWWIQFASASIKNDPGTKCLQSINNTDKHSSFALTWQKPPEY